MTGVPVGRSTLDSAWVAFSGGRGLNPSAQDFLRIQAKVRCTYAGHGTNLRIRAKLHFVYAVRRAFFAYADEGAFFPVYWPMYCLLMQAKVQFYLYRRRYVFRMQFKMRFCVYSPRCVFALMDAML